MLGETVKYDGYINPTLPQWLEKIPDKTRGIDIMGLRNPSQSIGNIFLSGITTVTPTIRYLSYRAWMVWIYAQWEQPKSEKSYNSFVRRVETAFALSNLSIDRDMPGIIGSRKGKSILDKGKNEVELVDLVGQKAYAIYTNASQQLGISREGSLFIPTLFEERGETLAINFDKIISGTKFYKKLKRDPKLNELSISDLEELGNIIRVDSIPSSEINILLQCLMPENPIEGHVNECYRIATYSILLTIAKRRKKVPTQEDFFEFVVSTKTNANRLLEYVRNGWLMYAIRDMLAVVYEKQFKFIHGIVDSDPNGVDENVLVRKILSTTDENIEILKDLGVINSSTAFDQLTFNTLKKKLDSRLHSNEYSENIRRWNIDLNEITIIDKAKDYDNVSILILIAWLIIYNRIEYFITKSQSSELASLLSRVQGHMSFVDSILPAINKYLENNTPINEVLEYVIHSTIEQHFRIAWDRFAIDSYNVAMIYRENNTLRHRLDFIPGQTQSRLKQAIGWLEQLGLVNKYGITPKGEKILNSNLNTLKMYKHEF